MRLHLVNHIRTNNFNDPKIMQKIKKLWEEATQELQDYNNYIYGVYYDYESDYKGDYCLSVAITKPYGENVITIPTNELYEIFKVDTTDTWRKIWRLEDNKKLRRAYSYDFEKYYPNGEVEIHIAVQPTKEL